MTSDSERGQQTPEQRYDANLAQWQHAVTGSEYEQSATFAIFTALRDMIANLTAEVNEYRGACIMVSIDTNDDIAVLRSRITALEERPTLTWKGFRQGVPLPDPDEAGMTSTPTTVYILLTHEGKIHSAWSSVDELVARLTLKPPPAYDGDTWQIVAAALDRWGPPTTDSVTYVSEARGSNDAL